MKKYNNNKKIFVTGDTSTRDKLKLTGFIEAFSKTNETLYIPPKIDEQIKNLGFCDILFGESGEWLNMDYSNIGSVFMWCVMDPRKISDIAKNNINTKFFICSKSLIHVPEISNEYIKKYGTTKYLGEDLEGIDVLSFIDIIKESKKIEEGVYQIEKNLFYLYLPCSLASSDIVNNHQEKDIDVTYFGTRENRPGVSKIIEIMKERGYRVVYNNPNDYISPEECLEYYKRSLVTLHEQVGPVYLEFPVRFGEASYCGSKIYSIDKMISLQKYTESNFNVPEFSRFENIEDLISDAIEYIKSYKNKEVGIGNRDYTYDFYCKKIIRLSNEKI